MKNPVPFSLRSRVVYQFTCAGCNACYVGETFRRAFVSIREGTGPPTFATLTNVEDCSGGCFCILDTVPNRFHLMFKEAAHIRWKIPV